MKKQLGNKIRVIRISRQLSQENMATELELSTGAYSNIERGITDITVTRLYRIAEILGTTVFELLSSELRTDYVIQDPAHKYGDELEQLRQQIHQQMLEMQKKIEQLEKSQRKK